MEVFTEILHAVRRVSFGAIAILAGLAVVSILEALGVFN